jgi:ATP-dependent exoDNAse (exonuclease V) beta subunit
VDEATRSGLAEAAADAFLDLRQRPEVSEVIDAATCHYEVPFSLRLDFAAAPGSPAAPVIVRGSIDCLAEQADGRVVVVEFKTGKPHDWHRAQLDLYVRAARAFLPARAIEGRLIYAGAAPAAGGR